MEQLTQLLKDGKMELLEVPFPALKPGHILVRNHFSVISAGTEGKTVKDARLGYIGKAKARKDEVGKVVKMAKTQGLRQTYNMVMNKLEAPSALGYSCAGTVLAVADDVKGFQVGDQVACAGAGAVHAEVVSIPRNLCVKVNENVPLQHAAFTTIASIAMQGLRQADLRLGENCAVIGLGLIGQLTVQLLKASGVAVAGIDIAEEPVALARKLGADLAISRKEESLENSIQDFTAGHGVDAVIITAGTSSLDPVELAGRMCRKKGKVVVVGAVPTGFSRKNYYRKELDLRMSSSYGPGRYDPEYEEKGRDYPIGYVRWTEKRNMQAFVSLLATKQVRMEELLTHSFPFEKAKDAYQMIMDKSENYIGIVLQYDTQKELKRDVSADTHVSKAVKANIGFVGAGSFAQNFLLPNVKGVANLVGVATARPNSARNAMDKYGFGYAASDSDKLMADEQINTVFVATRHDTHAELVLKALEHGKHVFVEKPLCMKEEELEAIKAVYEKGDSHLMLGFNRRFAPLMDKLRGFISNDLPKAIQYRVNAGQVPADHWVHDPEVGGGRVVGEACHFIDLAAFIAGSRITSVAAQQLGGESNLQDTLTIQLGFANGSIAAINYFSNGSKKVAKEHLEVFCGGQVAQLDDFKVLNLKGAKEARHKLGGQDKGHKKEVQTFLQAIEEGGQAPISFDEIYNSTLATFKVLESIREGGITITI